MPLSELTTNLKKAEPERGPHGVAQAACHQATCFQGLSLFRGCCQMRPLKIIMGLLFPSRLLPELRAWLVQASAFPLPARPHLT